MNKLDTNSSQVIPTSPLLNDKTLPAKSKRPVLESKSSPAVPKKKRQKKLTPKQAIFVQALLDKTSTSEAVDLAYPDTGYQRQQSYKLLRNDVVRDALLERLEKSRSIEKVGDYLDNVMTDSASKSDDTQERMAVYDRQHRASDLIIKVVGAYAPTKSINADVTDLLVPQRSKAR